MSRVIDRAQNASSQCAQALPSDLVGHSPAFEQARSLLQSAAPSQVTVLLTGETGTGKERFARELHRLSRRAHMPFQAVNCAALPSELIESELFGTERGAFTGAHAARAGRIERADGGTLLLDEVGDLPASAQAKLLRVLQFGEVERLGASQARKVDVRVIAATHVDLDDAVRKGHFRADLLYRLDVYRIHIPPLRERGSDIEQLAQSILERLCKTHHKQIAGFDDQTLHHMRRYAWPGNIRELENRIERAVILTPSGAAIACETLLSARHPASLPPPAPAPAEDDGEALTVLQEMIRRGFNLPSLERQLLQEAVASARGNLAAAARRLGITRAQLSYRLSKLPPPTNNT